MEAVGLNGPPNVGFILEMRMAKKAAKKETKSEFLRKVLRKNPALTVLQSRWKRVIRPRSIGRDMLVHKLRYGI